MLVYVVEDDATSRDNLTRTLRTQRHEVVAFSNAIDTTDYIAEHTAPDIALIDFQLESWPNGINLAKQVRLMYPNTAIVVISAYATPKDVATAFRQGVDDFIVRPCETDELLNSISEAALHHRPTVHQATPISLLGELRIDIDFRKAYWHGVDLRLTPTEFALITQFAARPAAVINFAELYSVLKGEHLPPGEARTRMKSHVANLRQKIRAAAPNLPSPIRTRWGHGVYWYPGDESIADESEDRE
ncbi:MAG: response regulator transcription factor [Aggregatilineales bacterium]